MNYIEYAYLIKSAMGDAVPRMTSHTESKHYIYDFNIKGFSSQTSAV